MAIVAAIIIVVHVIELQIEQVLDESVLMTAPDRCIKGSTTV